MIVKTLHWSSETDAAAHAQGLAARLRQQGLNACVCLQGDLGAGKTTWVRHLLRALGVEGRIKSPTYAVVESYNLPEGDVWHFDFYRFEDPREWEDAELRDIFAQPGLKLCEWPERVAEVLAQADWVVRIGFGATEGTREVQVTARTPQGEALL